MPPNYWELWAAILRYTSSRLAVMLLGGTCDISWTAKAKLWPEVLLFGRPPFDY